MKLASKRIFYPIRAVMLLTCALLFTGCAKPFYTDFLEGCGFYIAISGTNNSDIYDFDNVVLYVHYGTIMTPSEKHTHYDIPYIPPYFSSVVENERVAYPIKRENENFFNEKYLCNPLSSGTGHNHIGQGHWEMVTVPKEIFTENAGFFGFYFIPTTYPIMKWSPIANGIIFSPTISKNRCTT